MQKATIFNKLFLFCTIIGLCASSQLVKAQDYADYYYIWDKYLGTWYGQDNTVVSLTHDDSGQIMIHLRYQGREYDDGLSCFSPSYASADYLSIKNSGVSANFTAGISLSSSIPTLKLYYSGNNNAFYESILSRNKESNKAYSGNVRTGTYTATGSSKASNNSFRASSSNAPRNVLVGTRWQSVNRNRQVTHELYFMDSSTVRVTKYQHFSGSPNERGRKEVFDTEYSYDRGLKSWVIHLDYDRGVLVINGESLLLKSGGSSSLKFTRK